MTSGVTTESKLSSLASVIHSEPSSLPPFSRHHSLFSLSSNLNPVAHFSTSDLTMSVHLCLDLSPLIVLVVTPLGQVSHWFLFRIRPFSVVRHSTFQTSAIFHLYDPSLPYGALHP